MVVSNGKSTQLRYQSSCLKAFQSPCRYLTVPAHSIVFAFLEEALLKFLNYLCHLLLPGQAQIEEYMHTFAACSTHSPTKSVSVQDFPKAIPTLEMQEDRNDSWAVRTSNSSKLHTSPHPTLRRNLGSFQFNWWPKCSEQAMESSSFLESVSQTAFTAA